MSVNTTRRGLFALAAAVVGAGTLVAAKPAEAPAPEADHGHAIWQANFMWMVRSALGDRGLDPSLWEIDFDYDVFGAFDRVVISSSAYRDGVLTYAAGAVYSEREGGFGYPANQDTADMIVDGLARVIEEGW